MDTSDGPQGPDYIQSFVRGLHVIKAFSADRPSATLSELATHTGLARAVVRRLLLTLTHLGYVGESDGRFWLRPLVLELGYGHLSAMSLKEVAEQHLEALSAEVHMSSSMSILDSDDVVYVARVPAGQIMTVSINLGTRFPAYATSMGRVLLAGLPDQKLDSYLSRVELRALSPHTVTDVEVLRTELERVRQQGWCIVDQELEEGLRAVAVPVRSQGGRTIAAVNLSTHASRADLGTIRREFLPSLLAAAARIETDLAGYPAPDSGVRLSS
jgi:IclR family pca regulon transcriptional regulator